MTISVSLNGAICEQLIYSKEDDFEQLVAKNAETIFGHKAIYIDAKRKINTSSLGGTIPDGFLIDLSDPDDAQFYLVEVELQGHDFYHHIFPQVTKFFAFYRDSKQRHKLIETIFGLFQNDSALAKKLRNSIGSKEIYKFLKDTIDTNQNILIIVDGPKAEFKEIMDTYTDTWGKMAKVQIVNHFRRDTNDILTIEPPFQNLQFGDAVSPPPEKGASENSPYTEQLHLENRDVRIKEIYDKLKNEFLTTKEMLRFNPTKYYIGIVDKKQFAYIMVQKKKIRLIVMLPEDQARHILKSGHHTTISHSESVQRFWGGSEPNCSVEIRDSGRWDEIQELVRILVQKQEVE